MTIDGPATMSKANARTSRVARHTVASMSDGAPPDPAAETVVYDLRVTVDRIEGRSVCGMRPGDYFDLVASNELRLPDGKHFCIYALAPVLPFLAAKQRQQPARRLARAATPSCLPGPRRAADDAHRAHRRAPLADEGPDVRAADERGRARYRAAERQASRHLRRARGRSPRPRHRRDQRVRRPDVPAAAAGAARDRRGHRHRPPRAGLLSTRIRLHPLEIAGQVAALDLARTDGRSSDSPAAPGSAPSAIDQRRPVQALEEAAGVVAALLRHDRRRLRRRDVPARRRNDAALRDGVGRPCRC